MLTQALWSTLRILLLRAGPEDFPYDPSPRLTAVCTLFAIAANAAFFSVLVEPLTAIVSAALNVGLLAAITRGLLAAQKLANRFQQTFNALLATTGALTVASIPFFVAIEPAVRAYSEALRKNPDLMKHPEQMSSSLPMTQGLPWAALMLLWLWQLVIIAYIFNKAGGVRTALIFFGVMFALILVTMSLGGGA